MSLIHIENYRIHPANSRYYVFHYRDEQQANQFEVLLKENKLEFERDVLEGENLKYVFAIKKNDLARARKLNYQAVGKHREKFIPNSAFRWVVLLLFFAVLALGVSGWLLSN